MKRPLLSLSLVLVSALAGAQERVALPDMGSSASTLLSPEQARYIGQQMLNELRRQDAVLDDPLLDDYLAGLGYRIVAHSEQPDQRFVFFVVRSSAINAFAAPGGYVGVNAGLITTAESESELAAVLAHEVAHVTQQHIVRAVENMRNASIPIMLAMLGALIAAQSSNSSSSGEVAEAAIIGGQALIQQQQINFTRHNEYEADRIGIGTLARAGFDPQAMADFFARMGLALRANGAGPPEFLRTHPVTTSRISEAKNRARQLAREAERNARPEPRDPLQFALLRERARVLSDIDVLELLSYYERSAPDGETARLAHGYGHALALVRAGRPAEAHRRIEALARDRPDVVAFELALAEAEHRAGSAGAALTRLAALHRRHPDNRAVAIAYATTLNDGGQREQARLAMAVLRPLLARTEDLALVLAFARACELAGEEVRAGEAHAEIALLNGRFDDALGQLGNLLRRADVDYYQRARIEARIAQITPLALEERRRRSPLDRERERG